MKKILIILISAIILSGCNENRPKISEQNRELGTTSYDKTLSLKISDFGLAIENVDKKEVFTIEDAMIEDALLIKDDKKLLVAHIENGLMLYDLYTNKKPKLRGVKNLGNDISSLSLNIINNFLYVSDAEFIISIFELEELVLEMSYIKVLKEPI